MITNIPVSEVVLPKNVSVLDYPKELFESIKERGVFVPIVVRKFNGKYHIIDGRGRYLAALSLGIDVIPCYVIFETSLEPEFISTHSISIDPITYAKGLQTILKASNMTIEELAEKMDKSPEWIEEKLSLLKDE